MATPDMTQHRHRAFPPPEDRFRNLAEGGRVVAPLLEEFRGPGDAIVLAALDSSAGLPSLRNFDVSLMSEFRDSVASGEAAPVVL